MKDSALPSVRTEGIKAKVLGPLILAIVVLLAAFIFAVGHDQRQQSARSTERSADEVRKLLQMEQEQDTSVMMTTLQAIRSDGKLADAFQQRDREALLQRSHALFESLGLQHKITHFYFHLPDRVNLLRVHRPHESGDLINRYTLREAQRTGNIAFGIERGPIGTFVLRAVSPWEKDGQLLGYVELGIEFEDVVKKLHGLLSVDFVVAVYKEFLNREQWDKALETYGRSGSWDEYPAVVVMDKTMEVIPDPVVKYLGEVGQKAQGRALEIAWHRRNLQLAFLPLNDVSGKTLGELIVIRDVTQTVAQARDSIRIISLTCLIVGAVLAIVFYLFLGKVESELAGKTNKLQSEIVDRQRAEEELRKAHDELERRVEERTSQLKDANEELSTQIVSRENAQQELEAAHKLLIETSRQAGMAEVATGVLHNVGNVLNSVNVASACLAEGLQRSRTGNLLKVVTMLQEHESDLDLFLKNDPKGRQVVSYLAQLTEHLIQEQHKAQQELEQLQKHVEHIKHVVAMQQSYARVGGVTESVQMSECVEQALQLSGSTAAQSHITIHREYESAPSVTAERHKIIQILVNLLQNAKRSCEGSHREDKQISVRIASGGGRVQVAVSDNGVGIAPENLTRVFNQGFSTHAEGHGFGLHSGALAAKQMGGSLSAHSEGIGRGAAFILDLPMDQEQ